MTTITRNAASELLSHADGFTVSTTNDVLPSDGYFVGGVAPSMVTETVPSPSQLSAYVDTFPFADYVGIWTDTETHKVYVDVVEHYSSLTEAREVAGAREEIAIWDIENSSEIRL